MYHKLDKRMMIGKLGKQRNRKGVVMAKQKYENKRVISIVGTLDKNEDDRYIVTVEDKDSFQEYDLADILEELQGSVISLTSEIF